MLTPTQRHRAQVLGCLFLVYLSWGSCFISIRLALESFPPFLLCGFRMLVAGIFLYALTWLRGERHSPTRKDWKTSFLLAFFMVFISSGFLTKGEETLSSGSAAMILGAVPIWMVLGGWIFCKEPRPTLAQSIGLVTGFSGMVLLGYTQGSSNADSLIGMALVILAALAWVAGSIISKRNSAKTQLSVMRNSGLLMGLGGVQSFVGALVLGEFNTFSVQDVTPLAAFSLIYLIIFGAIIAYTCYFWLLMHTRTVVAISYEYVNPVIGVFLGWWIANEHVDWSIITACCLTVGSVFFVVSRNKG